MYPKLVASYVLIVSLLVFCGPMLAHHGNVAYDEIHLITISGTVTEIVWANPHVQFFLDVKDDKGKVVNWGIESQSPGILHRNGWSREIKLQLPSPRLRTGHRLDFPEGTPGRLCFPTATC